MFKRILNCEYDFVSPWWDDVSLNAKDLVCSANFTSNFRRISNALQIFHLFILTYHAFI